MRIICRPLKFAMLFYIDKPFKVEAYFEFRSWRLWIRESLLFSQRNGYATNQKIRKCCGRYFITMKV